MCVAESTDRTSDLMISILRETLAHCLSLHRLFPIPSHPSLHPSIGPIPPSIHPSTSTLCVRALVSRAVLTFGSRRSGGCPSDALALRLGSTARRSGTWEPGNLRLRRAATCCTLVAPPPPPGACPRAGRAPLPWRLLAWPCCTTCVHPPPSPPIPPSAGVWRLGCWGGAPGAAASCCYCDTPFEPMGWPPSRSCPLPPNLVVSSR